MIRNRIDNTILILQVQITGNNIDNDEVSQITIIDMKENIIFNKCYKTKQFNLNEKSFFIDDYREVHRIINNANLIITFYGKKELDFLLYPLYLKYKNKNILEDVFKEFDQSKRIYSISNNLKKENSEELNLVEVAEEYSYVWHKHENQCISEAKAILHIYKRINE